MSLAFKKATRRAKKLKIGVTGPTGSGKTYGALALGSALVKALGGRIALVDTENGSASLYADRFDFDTLDIDPPYHTKKYIEAIKAAIDAGYTVCVVDSITHQWHGEGGILQRKDAADAKPGANRFANWAPFDKEHEEFKALLLHAPIHLISTMRSKMAYQQAEGSKKVEKLGLQPIQREGMEYEFDMVFEVAIDHLADVGKDRLGIFDGQRWNLHDPRTGQALIEWLGSAAEETDEDRERAARRITPPVQPPATVAPARTAAAPASQAGGNGAHPAFEAGKQKFPPMKELMASGLMPIGTHNKGKPMGEVPLEDMESALAWAREKGMAEVVDFLSAHIEARRNDPAQVKLFEQPEPAGVNANMNEMPEPLRPEGDDGLPF
jgi:energy-coupling factor transporter ATP-binding protein EcfA2